MAIIEQSGRVPRVTEDDLLAFQYSHFGDDTAPDDWFVGAESALNFEVEDDGLGYYEDGTKRTLTDEQIAMFRHSEIQTLLRERRLHKEDQAYEDGSPGDAEWERDNEDAPCKTVRAASPLTDTSRASSVEADLIAAVNPDHDYQKLPRPEMPMRPQSSQSSPSHTTSNGTSNDSTSNGGPGKKFSRGTKQAMTKARRQRHYEAKRDRKWEAKAERERIPYNERNKRKWEKYIVDQDPNDGHSVTERRSVREMDNANQEEIELDY